MLKIILCPAVEPSHSEEMQKPSTLTGLSRKSVGVCHGLKRSSPAAGRLTQSPFNHYSSFSYSLQRTTHLFLHNKFIMDVKRAHELTIQHDVVRSERQQVTGT